MSNVPGMRIEMRMQCEQRVRKCREIRSNELPLLSSVWGYFQRDFKWRRIRTTLFHILGIWGLEVICFFFKRWIAKSRVVAIVKQTWIPKEQNCSGLSYIFLARGVCGRPEGGEGKVFHSQVGERTGKLVIISWEEQMNIIIWILHDIRKVWKEWNKWALLFYCLSRKVE